MKTGSHAHSRIHAKRPPRCQRGKRRDVGVGDPRIFCLSFLTKNTMITHTRETQHINQNQDSPRGNPFRWLFRCQTWSYGRGGVFFFDARAGGPPTAKIGVHTTEVSSGGRRITAETETAPVKTSATRHSQPWTRFRLSGKAFPPTKACSRYSSSPRPLSAASPVEHGSTWSLSRQTLHRAQQPQSREKGEIIAVSRRRHLPLRAWVLRAHPCPTGACRRWGRWTTPTVTGFGARGRQKLFDKDDDRHAPPP